MPKIPKDFFKKNKKLVIIISIAVLGLILLNKGGNMGLTKTQSALDASLSEKLSKPIGSCKITISPQTINLGSSADQTVMSFPNTECTVYSQLNAGDWQSIEKVTTNSNGIVNKQRTPSVAGAYKFAVICQDCVSAWASLKVNIIVGQDTDGDGIPDTQDPDNDNDSYPDKDENEAGTDPLNPNSHPSVHCSAECINAGYASGKYSTGMQCSSGENLLTFGPSGGPYTNCCCTQTQEEEDQVIATCTDTDGGDNTFVKGTVSGMTMWDPQQPYSYVDYCSDGTYLMESWCVQVSNGYTFGGGVKKCDYGCTDGKCNTAQQQATCTDSDIGMSGLESLQTKGTCVDGAATQTDVCQYGELYESYCDGNTCKGAWYYCASKFPDRASTCVDGACVLKNCYESCHDIYGYFNGKDREYMDSTFRGTNCYEVTNSICSNFGGVGQYRVIGVNPYDCCCYTCRW